MSAKGPPGNLVPVRNHGEIWTQVCIFDVGASGAHTIKYGKGMSVARTAAGKYTITFTNQGAKLLDVQCTHWAQAAAAPLLGRPTADSQDLTVPDVDVEFYDAAGVVTEIPSGDDVTYTVTWLKTA